MYRCQVVATCKQLVQQQQSSQSNREQEQLRLSRKQLLLGTHVQEIAVASIALCSKTTRLNTCRLRMKLLRQVLKFVRLGIGAPSDLNACLHGNA